jgi:hypothetical protein
MRRDPFAKPGIVPIEPMPEPPKQRGFQAYRTTPRKAPEAALVRQSRTNLPPLAPAMAKAVAAIPDSTLQYLVRQEGSTMSPDEARRLLTHHCRKHPQFTDWRDAWASLSAQVRAQVSQSVSQPAPEESVSAQQNPTREWRKNFLRRASRSQTALT